MLTQSTCYGGKNVNETGDHLESLNLAVDSPLFSEGRVHPDVRSSLVGPSGIQSKIEFPEGDYLHPDLKNVLLVRVDTSSSRKVNFK